MDTALTQVVTAFKHLLCPHQGGVSFERNLHGDEIHQHGGHRSLWRCKRCDKVFSQELMISNGTGDIATETA